MNQYAPSTNGAGAPAAIPTAPAYQGPGMEMAPIMPAAPPPFQSDLDTWTMARFQKLADQLEDEQLDELSTHLAEQAKRDKDLWSARDTRMRNDQTLFELSGGMVRPLGKENRTYEDLVATETQSYRSPIPWSFSTKMTAMLAGAGFRIHMAPAKLEDTSKAQQVENWCTYAWKEQASRMRLAGMADILWTLGHFGPLRGWMTVLMVPQSVGGEPVNQRWEIEDPIYVYPRFSLSAPGGTLRVTRQYTLKALEAKAEYPEAAEMLQDSRDDDEIECIGYYDANYHCILIQGGGAGAHQKRTLVGWPVRHGIKDIAGNPVNPWLIHVPLGNLAAPSERTQPSTALFGPGILHAVHESVNVLNRLISMVLNQVAKTTDPATVETIKRGDQVPPPLSIEHGDHNVRFDGQEVKILDIAANPQNFQPLFTFLMDMIAKVTFPSVFYGAGGSSGYDTGILQKAALDIVLPWSEGMQFMIEQMHRRMLEIAYWVTSGGGDPAQATHGPMEMQAALTPGGRQVARQPFDPSILKETGVAVRATLGRILPQDRAAMTSFLTAMTSIGAMSPYTAMVENGIDDPEMEERRIVIAKFLASNPVIGMIYAQAVANMSDDDKLQTAIQMANQIQQAMAAQAAQNPGEAMRQSGQTQQPTNVQPLALQAGAGQGTSNQQGAANAAGNSMMAHMMAAAGGSPERPTGG